MPPNTEVPSMINTLSGLVFLASVLLSSMLPNTDVICDRTSQCAGTINFVPPMIWVISSLATPIDISLAKINFSTTHQNRNISTFKIF